HLVLLCKNEVGYHNLIQLSSEAFTRGFYYKPRIDYDFLSRHTEGLICLSACLAGDIPQRLLAGRYDDAKDMAKRLQGMFGEDFYIELQDHGLPEQKKVLPGLVSIANELHIKTVATNDIHYVNKDDAEAQDVLLCIQTVRFVDEVDRMRMQAEEFYLKSEEEMQKALPNQPEAITNTQEVADKCELELSFGGRHLPGFTAPDGLDNESYLRKLCHEGLQRKMPEADDAARQRLEYELSVIVKMGFVDYFLIVWDFIHFAKTHEIMVGPGRGSGAGSLAAYSMDITDVNPIKYGLIFERFLNPERISMPDFDVDFCFERRQEVIDYVTEKYGADHVAQIITFGTMAARGVVRDVARVLRIPYGEADRIAKLVPSELNMTLERAMSLSSELRQEYQSNDTVRRLWDLCKKLEGLPRHASTHAAGVVISKLPITDVVPLQKNDESVTTQFPMGTLEEIGLLKMDFLGLRTLTVIRDALAFINKSGKEAPDLSRMEFNDPAVYQIIARGDTDGVFQLESAGMRQFMMQLKPDCFEDIIAGISLFRPGPMAQIPRYVAAKNGTTKVTYPTEKLQPILSATYGCMVYQEQVMQIVRDLAGYSLGRSDLVRRAMSKKKQEVMAQERKNFIHGNAELGVPGAVENGVPEQVADHIFDELMDFASYASNKSHAACYAVVAYRTAYLKLYYPQEFMAALINSYLGSADKVAEYVYAAKRMGITVLPPDVNGSEDRFSVEGKSIRFGLSAIRNVGEGAMQSMVREREQNGPFTDFFNFVERTDGLNKRMLENLIYAGCFDGFHLRRAQLIQVYDSALDASVKNRKVREQGQMSLFDLGGAAQVMEVMLPKLPDIPEYAHHYILEKERDALGIYISGHPLDEFTETLSALPYTVLDLQEADGTSLPKDNSQVRVGGLIAGCKQKPTKSGNGMMGYATLEGVAGTVELVLFPRTMEKLSGVMYVGGAVIVSGKLNIRDDQENSILVDEAVPLIRQQKQKTLYLRLPS
ncbi:MAG: DNA polymerase III subunit alpha, partial [Eubacteriales bacterium]|nr:DNA polymerase III subunit alpha [Eubacteriales bacterium]